MFCPNCGTQLDDNAKFCASCGTSIGEETPAEPVQPEQPAFTPPPPVIPQEPVQPAPVPMPQPVQQPYPQQEAAAVKSGPNPVLVFFLTFVLLGAIVASVILFWKPGYLVKKDDSSSKSGSSKSVKDDSDKDDPRKDDSDKDGSKTTEIMTVTAAPETSAPDTETEPPETEPSETETKKPVETEPPETEPSETETVAPPAEGHEDALMKAAKYSTSARPTYDDFVWCVGQYGYQKEMPSNAKRITDPYELSGGWKCFIFYDMKDKGTMREIDNVRIDVDDKGEITFTIDWYEADYGDGPEDETSLEDEVFKGKMTDGKLEVTGISYLVLDNFWYSSEFRDGQYAAGSIEAGDFDVYIALMRP